jgi:hypothetical protein
MKIEDIIKGNEREIKELTTWREELLKIANDKNEFILDRFECYKHADYCEKRVMGLYAHLTNLKDLKKQKK